jgi:hypothetical protein
MDVKNPENEHDFDMSEVACRLAAWRPASGGLDRDRMLYEAGRAAAQADGRGQSWRLATAALTLLTVGLGGLLAHERSQRRALETSIAMAARINPAQPAGEIASSASRETSAIEPFAPDSYFALTSRLARGVPDLLSSVEFEADPQRPPARPSMPPAQRRPLQPGDLQRVLEL